MKRDAPDLLLVDPYVEGVRWVPWLRQLREEATCRWIIITESASAALVREATRCGATWVSCKPASAAQLLAVSAMELGNTIATGASTTTLSGGLVSLAILEWEHINEVLVACNGSVTSSAKLLGIPRQTLYNKLNKRPRSSGCS